MDDNVPGWIKANEGKEFTDVFSDITSKIYDLLEYKKSKADKVTGPLITVVRKALEFLQRGTTELYTEIKVSRAKIEDREEFATMMQDLAQKISRQSVSMVEEAPVPKEKEEKRRDEDFTVIVTPNDDNQDPLALKEKIKNVCRKDKNIPIPSDVMTTKSRKVILKYKKKEDAHKVREMMSKVEEIKDEIKINVPIARRERILLLSVDPEVTEEMVEKEVSEQLLGASGTGPYLDIAEKIQSTSLDETTKVILSSIMKKHELEIKIVKKIPTRMGKNNWLIDLDAQSKSFLLAKKRMCIDFERYRVVEYISIMRCFKCQAYGHSSRNCDGEQHCAKCAGKHFWKDCKSETTQCANCYFENADGDCGHRADSVDCPIYQKYRTSIISNRS